MKTYRVGGCVRDHLLGLPVNDIDWVVTGATPAQMLAAGYKTIGRDSFVWPNNNNVSEIELADMNFNGCTLASDRSCVWR